MSVSRFFRAVLSGTAVLLLTTGLVTADTASDIAKVPAIEGTALGDVSLGSDEAPVTIIEYASITCTHCKHFHETVFPVIQEQIDSGNVKFIFRELPTAPKVVAMAGFSAARCAGRDQYYPMLDAFFASQEKILKSARDGKAKAELKSIAAAYGLNGADFETCVRDEAVYDTIVSMIETGNKLGVTSTPTLYMNGELLGAAAYSADGIKALIETAAGDGAED